MPVVFEQPQPVAPSVSYNYGQVQEFNQLLPAIQRQQQLQLEAQRQSLAGAYGGGGGRTGDPLSAIALQGQQQRMGIAAQGAQQSDLMAQRFAQTQQQEAQEFTYADNLRLQKLQQGLDAIQNNPNLSDEDKADLSFQVRTGIDRYKQKQQAAQTAKDQAEAERAAAQAKNTAVGSKTFSDFMTQSPDGIFTKEDPETGKQRFFTRDRYGEVKELGGKSASAGGAAGTKDETFDQYIQRRAKVAKELESKDKDGNIAKPSDEDIDRFMNRAGDHFQRQQEAMHRSRLPGDDATAKGKEIRSAAEAAESNKDRKAVEAIKVLDRLSKKDPASLTVAERQQAVVASQIAAKYLLPATPGPYGASSPPPRSNIMSEIPRTPAPPAPPPRARPEVAFDFSTGI